MKCGESKVMDADGVQFTVSKKQNYFTSGYRYEVVYNTYLMGTFFRMSEVHKYLTDRARYYRSQRRPR
jgi:hypothetical protein